MALPKKYQYEGALRQSDYGRITFQDFFTDADDDWWWVVRSSDSNGYTTVRAYSADADDAVESVDTSMGNLCLRVVRSPGKTEDRES